MYKVYTALLFVLAILVLKPLAIIPETNNTLDPFQWLKNIFDKGMTAIEDFGNYLLKRIITFLLFFSRFLYIIVAVVGSILWLSGLQPHRGRRFVIGAVLLAIVTELLSKILV